jgi:hypothetical protein
MFMDDSPKRRLLLSLVERARSVSEVAVREGLSIGSAHHLLSGFVKRGLAYVEREEKRAGRPIKHYRSVARSYFVPLEHVSGSPGGGLAAEIRSRLDAALSHSDEDGVLFDVDDEGQPRVSWFARSGARRAPVAEFWQILKLSEADAHELIEAMGALLNQYQGRAGKGRVFLIHGAVAPRARR